MQENAAAFRVFNWNIVCLTHWPLEDVAVIFQVYLFVDKDLRRHMTSLVHSELTHISQENATVYMQLPQIVRFFGLIVYEYISDNVHVKSYQ